MGPLTEGIIVAAIAMALFMSGMPIAFALGLTSIITVLIFLDAAVFDMYGLFVFDSLNDIGLLAIPLFVLMGNLFGGSQASKHLFEAGEAWLTRLRGGLAMSGVVASTIFAALTGASSATAAAIGRVAIPEMLQRGYSPRVATGAIAAGGTLGILIPPSVTLILYGIASEESIGQLFAAGIIPGLLITLLFCIWIFIATTLANRNSERSKVTAEAYAKVTASTAGVANANPEVASPNPVQAKPHRFSSYVPPEFTWGERFIALAKVIPFVLLVVGVLTVLYAGIATPSEAAAVGVILVLLLVGVVYRGLNLRDLRKILLETTNQSTMILTITAFSTVIAVVLGFLGVPQELAIVVGELEINRWLVMLAINIALLVMGLFLPPVAIIVMVTPVLYPLIVGLGFDPIWFGIIMTINMEMGLITPPVGLNLFVIKGIAPEIPLKDILLGALPYVVVLGISLVICSIFPEIITWLPEQMF